MCLVVSENAWKETDGIVVNLGGKQNVSAGPAFMSPEEDAFFCFLSALQLQCLVLKPFLQLSDSLYLTWHCLKMAIVGLNGHNNVGLK